MPGTPSLYPHRVFSWQICVVSQSLTTTRSRWSTAGIGYQKNRAWQVYPPPCMGARPEVCVTGRRPSTWRPTRPQRWRWVGLHHGHWQAGNPIRVACIPRRTGRLAPWAPGDTSQRMSSNSSSRTESPHHGCPARHVRAADARQSRQAGTVPGAHFRQRFGGRCPAIDDGKGNAPWCAR